MWQYRKNPGWLIIRSWHQCRRGENLDTEKKVLKVVLDTKRTQTPGHSKDARFFSKKFSLWVQPEKVRLMYKFGSH